MAPDPHGPPPPKAVLTRSAADNKGLAAALETVGIVAVSLPLIALAPPADDGRALGAAVDDLDRYRYVALTSVNAVRALAEVMVERERSWPARTEVAAVGPVTAAAAAEQGWPVAIVPAEATAASLVDAMPGPEDDGSDEGAPAVLAPLAELAADTLTEGLSRRGYAVDRVEAYRTVDPAPDAVAERRVKNAAVVTLFSPSAVDRFLDRLGSDRFDGAAVCVGPTTAARATEVGLGPVVTAEPHTEAGVVAAVRSLFRL